MKIVIPGQIGCVDALDAKDAVAKNPSLMHNKKYLQHWFCHAPFVRREVNDVRSWFEINVAVVTSENHHPEENSFEYL